MRQLLLVLVVAIPATAFGQAQVRTPDGTSATLMAPACINASGMAVVCSSSTPMPIAGTVTASPSGTPAPVTQSGDWAVGPTNGTPTPSAVTSLGQTSTQIFVAAPAKRRWFIIQNQHATAMVWCRPDGGAAAAASPSIQIRPASNSWGQGASPGFVIGNALTCISDTAGTPIAAWVYQQ